MAASVGDRVVAIRNGDDTTMYLYGHGTYLGDMPVPYWDPDAVAVDGKTWRQLAEEAVRWEMSQTQVEWVHNGRPMGVDNYGNPMGDTRTFEERVPARLDGMAGNPCIELDEGGRAWGFFCWWGPDEQYEKMRAGRDEVLVPLPDPLPRALQSAAP